MQGKFVNLVGKRFGRLIVTSRSIRDDVVGSRWICRCDCGSMTETNSFRLSSGVTQSCGCKKIDNIKMANTTHGMSRSRPYRIWLGMKARCGNRSHHAFHRYGGRGIKVCKTWIRSFESFWNDMQDGYDPALTLDRINNNLGYSKSNCQWATRSEQAINRTERDRNVKGQWHAKRVNPWESGPRK